MPDEPNSEAAKGPACGDLFVAGIGASAGGLEALESLFRRMPRDTGLAFVVVQHLSPDFESHMVELLGRQTDLPVHTAQDGMAVEPDHIYLLPPRKEMIIADGKLRLTDKEPRQSFTLPIDRFLRSLAQDRGSCAIAIILSGTGSDGARGLRDIHAAGGLVIAQTAESAKFDGMPQAAVGTGVVDLVLAPESIPDALVRYYRESVSREQLAEEQLRPEGRNGLDKIVQLLRQSYDIDFSQYKPQTVLRRTERRQALQQYGDLESYAERLKTDPDELNELYRDLLIGVTRFFRDREAFEILEQRIVPEILERVPRGEEIRVWIAACGSGEEAYSIAILFHEQLLAAGRPLNVKVFATDVHRRSLETASAAVYSEDALEEVTPKRRQQYFVRKSDGYHIIAELRQLVVFATHNVLSDAPFTRMDLVSCRNMLIYLQPAGQKAALSLFHFALKTGAVLFLGASETPGDLSEEFETLDKRWKLYRKRRDVHIAQPLLHAPQLLPGRTLQLPPRRMTSDARLLSVYDRLLSKFMPAGFLIDEQYQLIHTFADAGRFLEIRAGRHTNSLLDLLHADLRTCVSGAVHHALKGRKVVRFTEVPVVTVQGRELIDVTVEPFFDDRGRSTQLLIALSCRELPPETAPDIDLDVQQVSRDHLQSLENELRFTRENLQATIEELETANEELQATNEELVASNEELQSTNEELHSVNEELYTVNGEYQRKIVELHELTDDLDNLIISSDVGVVFLDRDLCIRRFTPRMSDFFRLMPQDVGRPISAFAHNIDYQGLLGDLTHALQGEAPVEREVRNLTGTPYFLRILPYRTKGLVNGVVVTLIDITALKRQQTLTQQLSAIVESSDDPIIMHSLEGEIQAWNHAATVLYGCEPEAAIGQSVLSLLVPEDRQAEYRQLLARVRQGERLEAVEVPQKCGDDRLVDVSLRLSPVREDGRIVGISRIDRDITERKQVERRLAVEHAVTSTLAESATLDQAMPRLLEAFKRTLNLDVVEFWTPSETTQCLTCAWVHVTEGLGLGRVWRDSADDAARTARESLPERAWGSRKVAHASRAEDPVLRQPDSVLRSGFAFPVTAGDECLGVVCAYERAALLRPATLDSMLLSIGREIGQFAVWSRSEQRVRQLAEVVEQMTDAVCTLDLDRRVLTMNRAGRELLGVSEAEAVRMDLAAMHPDWAHRKILQEGLSHASEHGVWSGETALLARGGREIPVAQAILAHHDATGEVRYFSTVIHDLSQQKADERALQQAREMAEAANAAKGTFLAHISHEVRTPMTAIVGLAELLLPGEKDRKRSEMLEMIGDNGRYLTEILNDILDLSKIEAGRFDVDLTRCAPVPLLANIHSLMEIRARSQGLVLEVEYRSRMPETILTDPIRLRQILVNLVGNAIKFTDDGCVRIIAELREGAEPRMAFQIVDTGCGISSESLATIFEPFVTGHRKSRQKSGTGLGLPISRRLAAALGGGISVRSEPGKGSEFTLTIPTGSLEGVPLLEPEEALKCGTRHVATETPPLSLAGVRVLVAEDTRSVQYLVQQLLEALGAHTTLVGDGRQAVDAVFDGDGRPHEYDVILMDMNMPIMNGFDAIQELQSRGCGTPIVALTAGAMRGDRERCLQAGCTAYITKPINRLELLSTLQSVLKNES